MTSPIPSEPRTGQQLYHAAPVTPAEGWWLLGVGVGLIYGVQIACAIVGIGGLAASATSDIACLAFFVAFARHRRFGLAGLGFVGVRPRWIVAAVLVGISAWYVNLAIVTVLHIPTGEEQLLKGLIEDAPLVPTLLLIAVLPAFAEEIVFRGILARALASRKGAVFGVLVSSAVFGMYHVLPAQVVATFMLGCLLGLFTLRSRSIVPSVIVHFLNNAMAVLVSRESVPGLTSTLGDHPFAALGLAMLLTAAGVLLALVKETA